MAKTPYPKTVAAVQAAEQSGWAIALALWEEVPKTKGRAKPGAIEDAQKAIHKAGQDGETYNVAYLSSLHVVGGWVAESSSRARFPIPVRLAMEARKPRPDGSRGLSPDEAEAQWNLGHDDGQPWTLRRWSDMLGRKWADVKAETAAELVERGEASGIDPSDVVVAAVDTKPESVKEAAEKSPAVQEAVNDAAHWEHGDMELPEGMLHHMTLLTELGGWLLQGDSITSRFARAWNTGAFDRNDPDFQRVLTNATHRVEMYLDILRGAEEGKDLISEMEEMLKAEAE